MTQVQQQPREHWSSTLGFIMAAAGSAIGLGTLWKFPYITGENGGGIFLLTYVLCIFLVGIPVFIAELLLGRKAQRGAVGIFVALAKHKPFWKCAGWLGVVASFIIMSYYSVVAGWGLNYVLMSLNQFYANKDAAQIQQIFEMVESSGDITLFWHAAFTLLTVALVYPGVRQGIEYWSKIMTTGLLVLMLGLCCFSMTLDGFWPAVNFLFTPDVKQFTPGAILEALGLAFFTLSLGQGIMLTYGSYMRSDEDIPKTAGIIGLMIALVSLLAGLTIFPVIFTFGFEPQGGPGLVFKTLPLLFSQLPGALFISTSFFVLFVFCALTSAVAFIEVVAANFMDLSGWSRHKAVIAVGIGTFVFGIPSALSGTDWLFAKWPEIYGKTFFETMDDFVSSWLLPIGGLLVTLFAGWVLDKDVAAQEFKRGSKCGWMWGTCYFFIRWIAPVAISCIILQRVGVIDLNLLVK